MAEGGLDLPAIERALKPKTKVVYAQRSRGYAMRPPLLPEAFAPLSELVHRKLPNAVLVVDNCYGEFTQETGTHAVRRGCVRRQPD